MRTPHRKAESTKGAGRSGPRAHLSAPRHEPFSPEVQLQRAVGNHGYARLLQAKLSVGSPDDPLEREADHVAEHVMRMPVNQVQRTCECEGACKHCAEAPLQRHSQPASTMPLRQAFPTSYDGAVGSVQTKRKDSDLQRLPAGLSSQIESLRGRGEPLPASERAFFEPRFGTDFSNVRVHTGGGASEAARALHARAFATGSDIVFAPGQYRPGTTDGRRLVAHELTHVVQQSSGRARGDTVRRNGDDEEFVPYILESSNWDEIRSTGLELARQEAFSDIDRIVVITHGVRVFDRSGRRLGTFGMRPGVAIPSGIHVISGPRGIQMGRRAGSFATRPSAATIDPEVAEIEQGEDEFIAIEQLVDVPEDQRELFRADLLVLVAGRPGAGAEEGDVGQGGGLEREGEAGEGEGGGEAGFAPDFSLEDAAGRTYQYEALPAEIRGLENQPIGGSGVYTMNLRYSHAAGDLLGQVAWGMLPVYYRWEVWDVTNTTDPTAREEAVRSGGLAEGGEGRRVGAMEGTARSFERTTEELAERPEQIRRDREEAAREGRWSDVVANVLNEELFALEVISRYGGNLVSATADLMGGSREREVAWDREGTFVVRCIAVIDPSADEDERMRAPSVATQVVHVRDVEAISRDELDRASADVAELQLQLLLLERLPEDHPDRAAIPQIEQQIEERGLVASGTTIDLIEFRLRQAREALARQREESRVFIEAGLSDSRIYALEREVAELEDQLRLARERVREINQATGAAARRLRAVLVSRVTGQTYPLILQVSVPFIQDNQWTCILSDVTSRDSSRYEGHAPLNEGDPDGAAARAVWEAVERYAGDAGYGAGSLTVRLPSTGWFSRLEEEDRVRTVESRERDWASARARLEELATAVAILGLVVASPGLGVAGGLLSASLAGERIARRMANGTFRWNDSQTIGDVIDVVGFAASIVGSGTRMIGAFRFVEEGDGFVLRGLRSALRATGTAAEAAEEALDIVGVIQCNAETAGRLIEIQQAVANGTMTATEARRQRAQVISGAIQSNAMTITSRVQSARAATGLEVEPSTRPRNAEEAVTSVGGDDGEPRRRRREQRREEAAAVEPSGPRVPPPPAEQARLQSLQRALGESVPVVEGPGLTGNTVEVVYRDGRLRVEVGPDATARHVAYHQNTVRQLRRYEGLMGAIRILFSRVSALLGGGPAFGERGFEAGLEVAKLTQIREDLEGMRTRIMERASTLAADREGRYSETDAPPPDIPPETMEAIDREIGAIQTQLERHLRDVHSVERGRGRVAMEDTSQVVREGDDAFFAPLEVGETRVYEEGGGHIGRATRESADVTVIETELQPGQTTTRQDYQGRALPAPEIDNFPIGQGGFERLHALGPLIGHESPFGILWGSFTLNRHLQEHGIETRLASLRETGQLPTGTTFYLTIVVERALGTGDFAGVEFLQSISYRVDIEVPGETGRRPALRLDATVDRPQDPGSGFGLHEVNLITNDVASTHVSESEASEGRPTAPRSRRRGDIRPEHQQQAAETLLRRTRELATALRNIGTAEATTYADFLRDMIRRIRSSDRMTQDEFENLRQLGQDMLDTFPELQGQFGEAFE